MAFTSKVPLRLVGAQFDAESGLIVLTFEDEMPVDEPNPVGWTPAKRYQAKVQPTDGLTEIS